MEPVRHTYIMESGRWTGEGEYISFDQSPREVKEIIRETSVCVRTGAIWEVRDETSFLNPPVSTCSVKTIKENSRNPNGLTWSANGGSFGDVRGRTSLVGNKMISSWKAKKSFSGEGVFVKIDNDTYQGAAVIYEGEALMVSWTTTLTRDSDSRQ